DILLQILFDIATPGVSADRVLNGPTSEVWIDPWIAHLKTLGVEFRHGTVEQIKIGNGRVTGVVVDKQTVEADYYIAAVPVERMADVIKASPRLVDVDPSFTNVLKLPADLETIDGLPFY